MKNSLLFLFGTLLILTTTACKRTIEGEQNRWNSNKETLERLSAEYSNFSNLFDEMLEKGQQKVSEAENADGEEKRIELLAAANDIINPRFVSQLDQMDDKINEIQDLASQASQASNDHSDSDAAWSAKTSADETIRDCRYRLKSANVATVGAAEALVSKLFTNLDRAEDRLNKVIKKAEEKKEDKEKTEEEKKTKEEEAKKEEEEKNKPIKCAYCGKMNDAGGKECGSCGAAISK